jgi:hypothetical protein
MTEQEWECLRRIDDGELLVPTPTDPIERLLLLKFAVRRPGRSIAVTGLGREALMRHGYNFSIPMAEPTRRPAANDEPALPAKAAAQAAPSPQPLRRHAPAGISSAGR